MGISEILSLVGQYGWWAVSVPILVYLGRTRPARTAGWVLSVNMWDRCLRRRGVSEEERRKLICSAARRTLDEDDPVTHIPAQTPRDPDASASWALAARGNPSTPAPPR